MGLTFCYRLDRKILRPLDPLFGKVLIAKKNLGAATLETTFTEILRQVNLSTGKQINLIIWPQELCNRMPDNTVLLNGNASFALGVQLLNYNVDIRYGQDDYLLVVEKKQKSGGNRGH